MINVMLVDDDYLVLDYITHFISWEKNGFKIICTAANGKSALRKYHELHPQVIFADVDMPFLNGIQMLKQIRKDDDSTIVILLTAYDDFMYAKEAVTYGAFDYILKNEFDETQIERILQNIKRNLHESKMIQRVVVKHAIEKLFKNELDVSFENNKNLISRIVKRNSVYILEIDGNISGLNEENDEAKKWDQIQTELIGILENYESFIDIYEIPENRLIVCNDSREFISRQNTRTSLLQQIDAVQRFARGRSISITAVIIEGEINIKEMVNICLKNENFFKQKYIFGCGRAYFLENLHSKDTSDAEALNIDLLCKCIDDCNTESIDEIIKRVFAQEQNGQRFLEKAKLVYRCIQDMEQKIGVPTEDTFQQDRDTLFDMERFLPWLIERTNRCVSCNRLNKRYSKTVIDAIEYINRNYLDPGLSIKDICESIGMSTSYFCDRFKKETGVTLREKITERRLSHAKILLRSGKYKIYNIAEMSGYSSPQYFSQVFIKNTGITPMEYYRDRTHYEK